MLEMMTTVRNATQCFGLKAIMGCGIRQEGREERERKKEKRQEGKERSEEGRKRGTEGGLKSP